MIICMTVQIQCAQDQQPLFAHAHELFSQEKYQDAFNVYQRVQDKEFAVYYNMGLCCLRQNKKTEALLFFKRAEQKATSYKELTLIQELLDLNAGIDAQAKGWYEQLAIFCKKVILATPIIIFQGFILLGLLLLIICWYMRWYKKNKMGWILFLIFWLIFYYTWLCRLDFMQQKYAVVMKEVVPVFSGPNTSFYKKADITESQLVKITDQRDNYYKIKLDRLVGWVEDNSIELV